MPLYIIEWHSWNLAWLGSGSMPDPKATAVHSVRSAALERSFVLHCALHELGVER
jgi:hypothetical protein